MIQEFNMRDSTLKAMVTETFGPDFYDMLGAGSIPNGIVSRFPITSHGAWSSSVLPDRDWDWAVVDLLGPRDGLVVSVHLHTKNTIKRWSSSSRHSKQSC